MTSENDADNQKLHAVHADALVLLRKAADTLHTALGDEVIMDGTPLETQGAMESAVEAIDAAIRKLESVRGKQPTVAPLPGGPTRQQGQFLAFIREYLMRNELGIAPAHADFQRFFRLTPPSVNSMLIRLEKLGFIRRIPGKARAIELSIGADRIPPLDRPFVF
jgi:repressor LexA